ncbi:MAG: LytTR family DNA-binding domain-containing protein [Bacteroidota bacterium]
MKQFLDQAYPLHAGKRLLQIVGLVFVAGFLFEYVFLPFNVNKSEHLFPYPVICVFHSANGALTYGVFFLIMGSFVNEERWKLYKELLAILVVLSIIGVNNFFLRRLIYDNPYNASLKYFMEEIGHAYLVGPMLFLGISLGNFFVLNASHMKQAGDLSVATAEDLQQDRKTVKIEALVQNDHFELIPDDLLYARADGNYVVFYLQTDDGVAELMKRMTLQSALDQLVNHSQIVRTHRAYLVNVRHIAKVAGNAQGYQLTVSNAADRVPVSRKHLKSFNQLMA